MDSFHLRTPSRMLVCALAWDQTHHCGHAARAELPCLRRQHGTWRPLCSPGPRAVRPRLLPFRLREHVRSRAQRRVAHKQVPERPLSCSMGAEGLSPRGSSSDPSPAALGASAWLGLGFVPAPRSRTLCVSAFLTAVQSLRPGERTATSQGKAWSPGACLLAPHHTCWRALGMICPTMESRSHARSYWAE